MQLSSCSRPVVVDNCVMLHYQLAATAIADPAGKGKNDSTNYTHTRRAKEASNSKLTKR